MEKLNILILSNMVGSGVKDDTILKEGFEKDGHKVTLDSVCFDEKLDETFDVIIRRNTWVSSAEDTEKLYENNTKMIERLSKKSVKTVNLIGLDGQGKGYLCDLFKTHDKVLPTIKTKDNIELLPKCEKYVIKDIKSFGNGLHQKFVKADELLENYIEGDIIQPFMEFKAEIQCYYVGEKLVYTFEYSPSKYPNYPEPTFIELTKEEKELADNFAKYSKLKYGFQRIDFLRLKDDSLLLMEIEDHAAFMNLGRLPENLLSNVLEEFKQNIYEYIQK